MVNAGGGSVVGIGDFVNACCAASTVPVLVAAKYQLELERPSFLFITGLAQEADSLHHHRKPGPRRHINHPVGTPPALLLEHHIKRVIPLRERNDRKVVRRIRGTAIPGYFEPVGALLGAPGDRVGEGFGGLIAGGGVEAGGVRRGGDDLEGGSAA